MVKVFALVGVLCIAALLVGAVYSGPDAKDAPRLITVTGEAQLNVVPDEVVVSIGTMAGGDTPSEAKEKNAAIAKKVAGLADELGIDRRHVQTDSLEIDVVKPEASGWRMCYDSQESKRYGARQAIRFTLKDATKLEPLLSRALEVGAVKVMGVDFRTTELRKYRDQARSKAIQAAREKAVALASELGQKVGKPHSINERPSYGRDWSYYGYWWSHGYSSYAANYSQNISNASGESSTTESIPLGQIAVTAGVNVSFELE